VRLGARGPILPVAGLVLRCQRKLVRTRSSCRSPQWQWQQARRHLGGTRERGCGVGGSETCMRLSWQGASSHGPRGSKSLHRSWMQQQCTNRTRAARGSGNRRTSRTQNRQSRISTISQLPRVRRPCSGADADVASSSLKNTPCPTTAIVDAGDSARKRRNFPATQAGQAQAVPELRSHGILTEY
jgi:hypothetical protein